jgi:hypothetical protein
LTAARTLGGVSGKGSFCADVPVEIAVPRVVSGLAENLTGGPSACYRRLIDVHDNSNSFQRMIFTPS